jgi:hypothetical protein
MFPNSKLGGDIHQGDLIAIADGNDFTIGIYFGRGRGGTVQYYHPSAPMAAKQNYETRLSNHGIEKVGPFKIGLIWKGFVNTPRNTRIIKLNRENITDQDMQMHIIDAKEILAQFNITVNF